MGVDCARRFVGLFICGGACFVLLVHIYLFRTMLFQERKHSLHTRLLDIPRTAAPAKIAQTQTVVHNVPPKNAAVAQIPWRPLQPLQEKDWNQYTIRINTWQRPEQLLLSVDWHSRCPGVAQIQIVWCDKENEPPPELSAYDKVIIERHEANSLNERFHVLSETPTLGILSIDDDVLRPCEAIDSGFFKWTQAPDRMVGFDGRLHVEKEDGTWQVSQLKSLLLNHTLAIFPLTISAH